jgi:DNA polymerase-3 subunit delta
MDVFAFLERPPASPQPVYVLHGDEDFLKRQALGAIKKLVLGEGDDAFAFSTHAGDRASYADVRDELDTVPFLCPRRLVVVENADPFVTQWRSLLEKYVGQPSQRGVLVLDVRTWPATTRLAKQVPASATLVCKAPALHRLPAWCTAWAQSQYGKQLTPAAAQLLVDLVGAEMGQLDQELNKLAIYVGKGPRIDVAEVDQLVGRSRAAEVFKIFDALGSGNTAAALAILQRLFDQGNDPVAILSGPFSWHLRRLAQAARLARHGLTLAAALERVGVPPFGRASCEQQLRRLGPRRAGQLYDWLLEADLGLKGSSQLSPRTLLERLIIRLARPRPD